MISLSKGFIHGDPNDMNIVINNDKEIYFIDWQDCSISFKIYDLAILIFSLMSITMNSTQPMNFLEIGKRCLAGYVDGDKHSLNNVDISLLPIIVQTRAALSLSVGFYSNQYLDPSNVYLLHTQQTGWKILEELRTNYDKYLENWIL